MGRPAAIRSATPVILLAGAVLLASCGSAGRSSTGSATTTTTTVAGPTATVKIGFVGALSGPLGYLGVNVQDGEKLAVSQFDAVNPPVKVALDTFDTLAGDNLAHGALRLVADKAVAVIGPTSGEEAFAVEPVLEQAGIPSITVTAADLSLAQHRWRYFHRLISNDATQGQADGAYLVDSLHASTVALVDDSTVPAREVSASAAHAITAGGAKVVYSDHLDARTADVASPAARIVAESPAAVFFAGSPAVAARMLTELRSDGFTGKFMLGGSDGTGLVRDAGTSAEGAYVACACAGTAENPQAQAFDAAFLAQFGTSPGPYAAEAYDATNLILRAIQRGHLSPVAINDYLSSVDYVGITRTVKFRADGNWAGDNVYVYKVQAGQLVEVGPAG